MGLRPKTGLSISLDYIALSPAGIEPATYLVTLMCVTTCTTGGPFSFGLKNTKTYYSLLLFDTNEKS